MTRTRIIVLALAAALVAVNVGLLLQARSARADDRSRDQAMAAVEKRLPLLLGYNAGSLEEDLATASEQTTGAFHADYAKILDEVVKPRATEAGVTTQAEVRGTAVVSSTDDEVVVLAFITQSTSSGGSSGGTPSIAGSRVEVTMKRAGNDWKVAGLEPV